ncbi:lysophospholipid acyltransferase family protein [Candidatus Rariloculus sp.]|uniref:lysophospholipid acyltransferase family protein n=1 Tax=Candidatus Rariloculus sp. TaxID=3101265 RepID=UPI003D0E7BBC
MRLIKAVEASDWLAPRYWLTWAIIAVMRLVALLPLPAIVVLGWVLGLLAYLMSPRRRRVAEINLRIAFPDASSREIRRLTMICFGNLGVAAFELGLAWWEHARIRAMCEFEGLEHLSAALKQGRGAILLTAHFTCLEIGGPALGQHVPFQVMYKRAHNALFDAFMRYHRSDYGGAAVDHHKPIALIKGLRKGYATWYAPDHDFGSKDTIFVPFFGVDATALTAPARIAQISGAPVVPYYIRRKPRGRGYELRILPPLEDFPTGDAERDARIINEVIERMIRRNPRQYLWSHKRYKNRPAGQPPVYPA